MSAALPEPSGLPAGLALRQLGPADLESVYAMHARLHAHVPPPAPFVRETRDFFARHLGGGGAVLGLSDAQGSLVGYSVLGLPAADDPANFGADLSLTPAQRAGVAHLDGTGITPAWRGYGLQRHFIRQRLNMAVAAGRRIALSTAAPENAASLLNLLAEGMQAVALCPKYDGLRFIVLRGLDGPPPRVVREGPTVALWTANTHLRALADGWVGVTVTRGGDGVPALRYAEVAPCPLLGARAEPSRA